LPDGKVVFGKQGLSAWLAEPTERYDHGILGDGIEAAALVVETGAGQRYTLQLPFSLVFEDRYPRMADLDADGDDEIYLVRSHRRFGAALVVVDLVGEELKVIAESEPIGMLHRWLNPVGAADFDGDGKMEIAVVITPHIGGTLKLYEFTTGQLVPEYEAYGFSNHFIGSRELEMSAVVDLNQDGIADLAVPDAVRYKLRLMTIKDHELIEIETISPGSRINTEIVHEIDSSGKSVLKYGLVDGRGIEVRVN